MMVHDNNDLTFDNTTNKKNGKNYSIIIFNETHNETSLLFPRLEGEELLKYRCVCAFP